MVSEEYIRRKVLKWAVSPAGKAKIKKVTGRDFVPKLEESEMIDYGREMKRILFEHIQDKIKSFEQDDIIIGKPIKQKDNYCLTISFREESLHRDSLIYPRSSGVENIVLLFTKGYHARRTVRGPWKKFRSNASDSTVVVRSKKDREPDNFLQMAVKEFNEENEGIATAKLTDKYKING